MTDKFQRVSSPSERVQIDFLRKLQEKLDAMDELLKKAPEGIDKEPFQAFKNEHEQVFNTVEEKLTNGPDANAAQAEERQDFKPQR